MFVILMRILFFFNIVGPYGVVFATILRDSVSLLRFPFFSHIYVFSRENLLVCCLKYSYNCFSSHLCSRCIDLPTLSSLQACPLPPSFLDTYNLSMSSVGCKALCTVISFLVFRFIIIIIIIHCAFFTLAQTGGFFFTEV